ncbi:hypothetical protein TNCV_1691141 [Trichonephila clavipes]|nr:hypothetical protein TNCV_1691141 [Trichonephila clavipes]
MPVMRRKKNRKTKKNQLTTPENLMVSSLSPHTSNSYHLRLVKSADELCFFVILKTINTLSTGTPRKDFGHGVDLKRMKRTKKSPLDHMASDPSFPVQTGGCVPDERICSILCAG